MKKPNFHTVSHFVLTFHDVGLGDQIQYIGRNNYSRAYQPLKDHDHGNAIEFAYLVKGRQVYNTQHQDYVLGANDVFVAFPHETHSTANWPEEKGILYWIIVKIPGSHEHFLDLPLNETRILKERLLALPRRVFSASANLARLFDSIFFAYYQAPDNLKRIILKSRCLELLTSLIEYAENSKTSISCNEINKLLSFIDQNIEKNLSIPYLAKRMNLSTSWFKTKFLKNVGMSPAQYILNRKIDRAKILLRKKDKNITGIAMNLGFSSSGYFATVFKRFTGQKPSDYCPWSLSE
jgi:AraC-like DNA-binding protein